MDNQSCRLLSSFYIATGSLGEENRSFFLFLSLPIQDTEHPSDIINF